MNYNAINLLGNVNFKQSNYDTTPSSKLRKTAGIMALATLTCLSGCDSGDVFNYTEKHVSLPKTDVYLHHPPIIRMEREMLNDIQDKVGDYYEVKYLPREKAIELTAGDICDNEINSRSIYPYSMENLRGALALKPGVILKNNPELGLINQRIKQRELELPTTPKEALELGEMFFSPTATYYSPKANDIDSAILLPGNSILIPTDEIGQKLRWAQSSSDFYKIKKFREIEREYK